jgi:hypothetical protein
MDFRPIIVALWCAVVSACVSTDARMLDDRTVAISGKGAASRSGAEVYQASLVEAAKQAQAHGFELFQVQSAADATRTQVLVSQYSAQAVQKPGVDLVVKFYRAGEIAPDAAGVFVASSVLAAAAK